MASQTPLARKRRARRIYRILAQTYPDAHCELDFESPFQLLVATVLSAQCTDARVNSVTPGLFQAYPTPQVLAGAPAPTVEELIRPTGFFRAKTTSLLGIASALVNDYDGAVPETLAQLTKLPGVGRKTANVVLGNAFGVPGITVDTHVRRLSRRLGLTEHEDPEKIEQALMALYEPKDWTQLSHVFIWHGRRMCHARKPACGVCPVDKLCPSAGLGPTDAEAAAKLLRQSPRG